MPTYAVPTLDTDGRTASELVSSPNERAAIAEATTRGLRVAGMPTMIPDAAQPHPPTSPVAVNVDALEVVFERLASAGLVVAWMGLIFVPFSMLGIVFGLIGRGKVGTNAVIAGLFTFLLNVIFTVILYNYLRGH
jgi:hypothetical protein